MASFRFRQRQVADPRAQENFEQLEGDLPKSWLQLAAPLVAGRKIARGTTLLTWTAATGSGIVTVTHGLGTTPTEILATLNCVAVANRGYAAVGNIGATTFQIAGELTNGAATGSLNAHWVAIG